MMHCLCFCLCACTCTCAGLYVTLLPLHIPTLYLSEWMICLQCSLCSPILHLLLFLYIILLDVFMHMCMICCCKYILPPSLLPLPSSLLPPSLLPSSIPPSSVNPPTASEDRSHIAETAATHQVTLFSPTSGVAIHTTDSGPGSHVRGHR